MYKLICHIFSFLWSSAVHALQPKIKDYYTKSVLRQQRLWKSKAAQLLSQEWFYLRASQCFKLLQQDVLSQSHISFQLVILPPRPLQFLVWKRSTLWVTMVRLKFLWCSRRKGASESSMRVCSVCVCVCEYAVWLTAVTLEISLQVLRRPLCSKSLCWMTLCMAAGLSEPISISWLADNSAVSRVCWRNTQHIKHTYSMMYFCHRNL